MTTLALPPPASHVRLPMRDYFTVRPQRSEPRQILLLSDDDAFWQNLLAAASQAGRKLVRERASVSTPRTLRLVKPAVVLLDLDLPSAAAWDAADSLLQDATSPPLLLLTSRSDQADFKTAIQAGSLIDKSECPARILELADAALESTRSDHRERNAMQLLVIRWLKPCNWSAQVIPLRRFWGINE